MLNIFPRMHKKTHRPRVQDEDNEPDKTPVPEFEYKDESRSVKSFVNRYKNHLPVIVKVTEGFCSPDEGKFTFSVEDTYWISHIKKQKRMIGKADEEKLNFSIPFDSDLTFKVIEQGGGTWGPSKLEDIAMVMEKDMDKYADQVYLDPMENEEITVWQGAENQDYMKLKRMKVIDIYEETYLVGSPVIHKHLHDYRCPIPVFVPIKLAAANDVYKASKQKAFEKEMQRLVEYTAKFPNDRAKGNQEIMVFTDDQVDHYGGDYEYIDPYEILGNIKRAKEDKHGYTKVDVAPVLPPIDAQPPPTPVKRSESRVHTRLPAPPPRDSTILDNADEKKVKELNEANRPASSLNYYTAYPGSKTSPELITSQLSNLSQGSNTSQGSKTSQGSNTSQGSKTSQGSNTSQGSKTSTSKETILEGGAEIRLNTLVKKPTPISSECNLPPEKIEKELQKKQDEDDFDPYTLDDDMVYAELSQVPRTIDFLHVDKKRVGEFLRLLRLHQYIQRFSDEDIDGPLLVDLDKDLLKKDFGFTGLEATKLYNFVHKGWRPA